jgi:catechol 2,3-dioxygenase-like lactoylglutathione lyase family enzyme
MSFQLHHVHLLCSDLKQTERFFIENLGARLEKHTTFGGAPGSMLDLKGAKIYLRTAKAQEIITCEEDHTCYGFNHVGLQVDDMEAVYGDLLSSGVEFSLTPKETPGGLIAFIKGPDNIVIELYQSKD